MDSKRSRIESGTRRKGGRRSRVSCRTSRRGNRLSRIAVNCSCIYSSYDVMLITNGMP